MGRRSRARASGRGFPHAAPGAHLVRRERRLGGISRRARPLRADAGRAGRGARDRAPGQAGSPIWSAARSGSRATSSIWTSSATSLCRAVWRSGAGPSRRRRPRPCPAARRAGVEHASPPGSPDRRARRAGGEWLPGGGLRGWIRAHSRFSAGVVEANTLHPDYQRAARAPESRVAYAALLIGKETIAFNDRTGMAGDSWRSCWTSTSGCSPSGRGAGASRRSRSRTKSRWGCRASDGATKTRKSSRSSAQAWLSRQARMPRDQPIQAGGTGDRDPTGRR